MKRSTKTLARPDESGADRSTIQGTAGGRGPALLLVFTLLLSSTAAFGLAWWRTRSADEGQTPSVVANKGLGEADQGLEQAPEAPALESAPHRQRSGQGGGPRRLGLHVTAQELAIWRQRAENGPYRFGDDASLNSPGDWDRISTRAELFLEDPSAGRWDPDWGGGPIPQTSGERYLIPDPEYTTGLRDAAFYALVNDDEDDARVVIDELLAQARTPSVDFNDQSRFPRGEGVVTDTNPFFMTAAGLSTLLFAADYVKAWVTAAEIRELRAWHAAGAAWVLPDMVNGLDQMYADRQGGDYTPVLQLEGDGERVFLGGPRTTVYSRAYNNRAAAIWLYIALVGLDHQDAELQRQVRLFYQEWVRFSLYPRSGAFDGDSWEGGGFVAELHRFTAEGHAAEELGWSYSVNTLDIMGMIADHFARAGDTTLYDYSTRAGLYGTEASLGQEPKSLLFAIRETIKLTNGTVRRYATTDLDEEGDSELLIDGSNPRTGWQGVQDVGFAIMNLYYRDPLVRAAYLREGPGFDAYPPSPAKNALGSAWQGHWGMYPGVLFQAGQLEGVVDPYPR